MITCTYKPFPLHPMLKFTGGGGRRRRDREKAQEKVQEEEQVQEVQEQKEEGWQQQQQQQLQQPEEWQGQRLQEEKGLRVRRGLQRAQGTFPGATHDDSREKSEHVANKNKLLYPL